MQPVERLLRDGEVPPIAVHETAHTGRLTVGGSVGAGDEEQDALSGQVGHFEHVGNGAATATRQHIQPLDELRLHELGTSHHGLWAAPPLTIRSMRRIEPVHVAAWQHGDAAHVLQQPNERAIVLELDAVAEQARDRLRAAQDLLPWDDDDAEAGEDESTDPDAPDA